MDRTPKITGIWALLTKEQRDMAVNFAGDEALGPSKEEWGEAIFWTAEMYQEADELLQGRPRRERKRPDGGRS